MDPMLSCVFGTLVYMFSFLFRSCKILVFPLQHHVVSIFSWLLHFFTFTSAAPFLSSIHLLYLNYIYC